MIAAPCLQVNRGAIVLQNDSDADMFLAFDGSSGLTAANGLRLVAGGILSIENVSDQVNKANSAIYAIHAGSGSKTLRIQEFAAAGHSLAPL